MWPDSSPAFFCNFWILRQDSNVARQLPDTLGDLGTLVLLGIWGLWGSGVFGDLGTFWIWGFWGFGGFGILGIGALGIWGLWCSGDWGVKGFGIGGLGTSTFGACTALCIHTYIIHTYTRAYIHIHTYIHAHAHAHSHTHKYTYMHIHACSESERGVCPMSKRRKILANDDGMVEFSCQNFVIGIDRISVGNFKEAKSIRESKGSFRIEVNSQNESDG